MATYSQNPQYDAHTYSGHPDTNYGTTEYLNIAEGSTGIISEIYLKFDLSSLKTGYVINSATLRLFQYDSPDDWFNTIEVAAELCASSWSENGITTNNKPGTLS